MKFAMEVERRVEAAQAVLEPGRELHANVEFYAGVVTELCGLPRSIFTPTFAAVRVVGWDTTIGERGQEPKVVRPVARHMGAEPLEAVPDAALF